MTKLLHRGAAVWLVALAYAALAAPAAAAPATPTPTPTSEAPSKQLRVVAHDPRTGKLSYVEMNPSDPKTIDVSDMTIDHDCAFYWSFGTRDLRISLLSTGCAHLLPGKGSSAEKAAERKAEKSGTPTARPRPSTSTSSPAAAAPSSTWWPGLKSWLGDNWLDLVGVLLAIASLSWVLWWVYSRRVRVLLAGAPSAGKSDLWIALREGSAPASNSRPSVGQSTALKLDPIPFGRYTLHPSVTDLAGAEPWRVIDELEGYRTFRWKRKLVLVVVASPVSGNRPLSPPDRFDDAFVEQQKGYMSLPRSIIGSKNQRRRPDLVVLFISKFDLVSSVAPNDSTATAVRQRVIAGFREHANLLESVCRERAVPYHLVLGSAKHGWGVDQVTKKLQGVIK